MNKHKGARLRSALIGLFLALTALSARAAEPVAVVPYRIDYHGWFTVAATVNGQGPFDFIVDTGATQSLVFRNLADIQNFAPSGGPPQLVLGLGSQAKFPTHVVGEVAIGNARLDRLVTVILQDWQYRDRSPQGVLGLDFLTKYEAVFDRQKMELRLYATAPGRPAGTETWKRAPLETNDFGLGAGLLYTITGKTENRSLNFLLDLGASGTIINHPALGAITRNEYHISVGPSTLSARVTDALENTDEIRAIPVRRFRAGQAHWYRRVFFVHNAPIFADLGRAGRPYGLFGADLLHDRSFALDFADLELLVAPARSK